MKHFVKMLNSLQRKLNEVEDNKVIGVSVEKSDFDFRLHVRTSSTRYGIKSKPLKPHELENMNLEEMNLTMRNTFGLQGE